MAIRKNQIVDVYAQMWPREVFDYVLPDGKKTLGKGGGLPVINRPGIYVLYRDDIPYYIGQAKKLSKRLWDHSRPVGGRYSNFWNYFSAFVIEDGEMRNEVEGILIAAMPTANRAEPKLEKAKVPPDILKVMRSIRRHAANPLIK